MSHCKAHGVFDCEECYQTNIQPASPERTPPGPRKRLVNGEWIEPTEEVVRGTGCMTCNDPDLYFRDAQSRDEYAISGMCQTCQDNTFK